MTRSINTVSHWGLTFENEYLQQDSDTLVVLFPGQGYFLSTPYLYYSYSMAEECGYDILALEYGFQKANKEFLLSEINYLIEETKETLQSCLKLKQYKNIIYIGKSLGVFLETAMIEDLAQYQAKYIYLTPTRRSLEGIKKSGGFVVVGNEDQHMSEEDILEISNLDHIKLKLINGVGHGLDKKNYKESILTLLDVMEDMFVFIQK